MKPPESKRGGSSESGHVASNRKAFHDYRVLERFEAGIELRGTEVKSLRARQVSLAESYARPQADGIYVHRMHIQPYEHGNVFNHDPLRPRRLLLHRREMEHLAAQVTQKGRTLVPLAVYFKRGHAKLELGLCTGKELHDKRETLKRRTDTREAQREISSRMKRR